MRTREHQIKTRLDDKEFVSFQAKLRKTGLSTEEYLRSLIEGNSPKELPPMQFHDVLRELRQINVNMNQIAMKAHTLNFIDAPFYSQCQKELQTAVGKIMRAVYG